MKLINKKFALIPAKGRLYAIRYLLIFSFFNFLIFTSCKLDKQSTDTTTENATIERPAFSSDSAYEYVQQQVNFGPRIPGTISQIKCASWLEKKLQQFGASVIIQNINVTLYNGKSVPCINVIGSYNPQVPRRILLCSHWDTRPFADQEKDPADQRKTFDGADDGPSGVAVLLEIARQLQQKNPEIGVDIVFLDVEDYGQPEYEKQPEKADYYCLGTQYWCKNPHVAGYRAENGILLDMVGGKGATFTYEGVSMQYAQGFMKQVWKNAAELGYSNIFILQPTEQIIDDHYYINTLAKIPTIDIIYRSFATPSGFAPHWHTLKDNMDVIDKGVLQAVGETVLATVYNF